MSNIKVAVRVRPLIQREIDSKESQYWLVKENTICQDPDDKSSCSYTFDHVFDQNATNAQVYQQCCHPIVESVMNGFNGTIFAYGQTSSGKTHTMFGTADEPGLVQLAVSNIFNIIENVPEREYLLRISYMEIYKETLYDLLDRTEGKILQIREGVDGQPFVTNMMEITVSSPEAILTTMQAGEKLRHVGETDMNHRSSRSHTLFRMVVESSVRDEAVDRVVTVSQLNLVDLAGSERMEQAGTSGNRFREGVHINSSLSVLSQVISKLSRGERGHINYRDSKLTRILQNSLGGNAHTAIICNVTPASLQQTHCTLRFASSAKKIQNKPVINEVISNNALLRRYHQQMEQLQVKIKEMEAQNLDKKLEEKNSTIEELQQKVRLLREQLVVSTHAAPQRTSKLSRRQRRETWAAPRLVGVTPIHRPHRAPLLSPVDECGQMEDRPRFSRQRSLLPFPLPGNDFVAIDPMDFQRHLDTEEKRRISQTTEECILPVCDRTLCQENLTRVAFLENEVASLTKELEQLREMTTLEQLCCNTSRKRRRTAGDLIDLLSGDSPCLLNGIGKPSSPNVLGSSILTGEGSTSSLLRRDDSVAKANEEAEIQATGQATVDAGTAAEGFSVLRLELKDAATETDNTGDTNLASIPLVHLCTADKETSTNIVPSTTHCRTCTEDSKAEAEDAASQTEQVENFSCVASIHPRTVEVGTDTTGTVSETRPEVTAVLSRPCMRDQGTYTDTVRPEVKNAMSETEKVETVDFSAVALIGPGTLDREVLTDMTMLDFPAKPEVNDIGLDAKKIEMTDFSALTRIEPSTSDQWTTTELAVALLPGLFTKVEVKDAMSETEKVKTVDFAALAAIRLSSTDQETVTDILRAEMKDVASGTDRVETVDFSAVASIQLSRSDRETATDACQMVSTGVCAKPNVRDSASETKAVETADFSTVVSIRQDSTDRGTTTDVCQTVSVGVCAKPSVRDSASGTAVVETADFSAVASIRLCSVDEETATDVCRTVSIGITAKAEARNVASGTEKVETADSCCEAWIRPSTTHRSIATEAFSSTVDACILARCEVREVALATVEVVMADFGVTTCIRSTTSDQCTTTDTPPLESRGSMCKIMPAIQSCATSLNRRHFDRDATVQTEGATMVDKSTSIDPCFSPSDTRLSSTKGSSMSSKRSAATASVITGRKIASLASTQKCSTTTSTFSRDHDVDTYFAPFIEHVEKCGNKQGRRDCRHGSKAHLAHRVEEVERESRGQRSRESESRENEGFARFLKHVESSASEHPGCEPERALRIVESKSAVTMKGSGFKELIRPERCAQKQGVRESKCAIKAEDNVFERFLQHVERCAQKQDCPLSEEDSGTPANSALRGTVGVQTDSREPEEVVELRSLIEQQKKRIRVLEKGCSHKETNVQDHHPCRAQDDISSKTAASREGHHSPLRQLQGDERCLALMSPGSREEELIMRVAATLPGRGTGDNMVVERLTAQLNHKSMQLENLQRRFLMLSSRRKMGTCSQKAVKDAATSPGRSGKENVPRGEERCFTPS